MLNTSKLNLINLWDQRQDALIASLKSQPLVILIRISEDDLRNLNFESILSLINQLILLDIKNIEIAWSSHKNWSLFIKKLQESFQDISFAAASVHSFDALTEVAGLGLKYSMSPVWDIKLQTEAKKMGQILIPGVLLISEIKEAIDFGYRIIKLFPVSKISFQYINQLKKSLNPFPLIIAAGGVNSRNMNQWLSSGCDAVILGRQGITNYKLDPLAKECWDQIKNKTRSIL